MKRLFIDWLKKTNRFKAFFNNAGHHYHKCLNRISYESYIAAAFPWITSIEGNYYWYQCYNEWETYYKRYLATHSKFYKKHYKP